MLSRMYKWVSSADFYRNPYLANILIKITAQHRSCYKDATMLLHATGRACPWRNPTTAIPFSPSAIRPVRLGRGTTGANGRQRTC